MLREFFRRVRVFRRFRELEAATASLIQANQNLLACRECHGIFVGASMFYVGENETERLVGVVCRGCRRQVNRATHTVVGNVRALEEKALEPKPTLPDDKKPAPPPAEEVPESKDGVSGRLQAIRGGPPDEPNDDVPPRRERPAKRPAVG